MSGTGYTHAVVEGKMTDFTEFALKCARAIDYCIDLKEAPDDAPLEFKESTYYQDRLAEAQLQLRRVQGWTDADWAALLGQRNEAHRADVARSRARMLEEDARIQAMREKVLAWIPPTPNHEPLKEFMLQQLGISGWGREYVEKHYPVDPDPLFDSVEELKTFEIENAERDVARFAERRKEEVERFNRSTEWVEQLRASLPTPVTS